MWRVQFEDWQRWASAGCRKLPATAVRASIDRPGSWAALASAPAAVVLESARRGRYTFACREPWRVMVGWETGAEIWTGDMRARVGHRPGDPLSVVQDYLRERAAPNLSGWPAMTGGLIGVFGYDLVHTWEKLTRRAVRDLDVPLYAFIEPRALMVYDHQDCELGVVVWTGVNGTPNREHFERARSEAVEAVERWTTPAIAPVITPEGRPEAIVPPASFTGEAFERAVRRVQECIAAGESYQVNLSIRETRATPHAPWEIYEALRHVNPSPYMGLLKLPDWALVCGSPELLVRLVDGVIQSRPIAGTRPRGAGASADAALSNELWTNAKERAEHLMLVDLIRNDVGRVAEFGSVRVDEFMVVERYSHVMHLVSQVEGRLATGRSWEDVVRAMFPGGTITGCPKYRTMEIIEELEPVGRGFYTGALGWISYGGAMEFNIVIRSMLLKDGLAHVQTGAGIVADSQAHRELDEVRRKAQALWTALDTTALMHG